MPDPGMVCHVDKGIAPAIILRQKAALYANIRAYAEHQAGTDTDWDPVFETAAIEHWLATERDE